MASIDAVLNLVVAGSSKIDQIINKVNQLDGVIAAINKNPIDLSVSAAEAEVKKFSNSLLAIGKALKTNEQNIDKAVKKVDRFTKALEAADRAISSSNPNTKKYEQAVERKRKANEGLTLALAELKEAEEAVNKIDSSGALERAEYRKKEAKEAVRLTKEINTLADQYLRYGEAQKRATGGQFAGPAPKTISQLNAQAQALALIASNSEVATAAFNRFTLAAELAGQATYYAQQEQLKALSSGLSTGVPNVEFGKGASIAAARNQVREFVDSFAALTKSEAAMGAFVTQAQRLKSLLPDTVKEFTMLEEVISKASEEIKSIGAIGKIRIQVEADEELFKKLKQLSRRRGNPEAYAIEAGPLPSGERGGARYFAERLEIAEQLLEIEKEIGAIQKGFARERKAEEKESEASAKRRLEIYKNIQKAASRAGDVIFDATTFGKSAEIKKTIGEITKGARNALVRGGLGLGALGAGGLYEGIKGLGNIDLGGIDFKLGKYDFGSLDFNAIKGPISSAAGAIGDAINGALGGIPEIINNVLSGLGDIPSALGLAAVAAYAFAPAMKTAADAVFLAGQKFGESDFGQNIKLTLDRQTNIFEDVINVASEMNMTLDASKSGLDAVGQAVRSLPALPAAGQTSFQGEIRQVANRETLRAIEEAKSRGKGLPGGFETTFIGGGARALKNAEFLADATGKIAARSEEAAQATSMFAEGLGQAVREAKAIADYLDQANRLRSTGEPKTQQFIRQTRERGQVLLENQRSVEIARERSAALLGEQYLLSQVPARGELLPGGRTETRQPDYRAMLNNQALIRQYVNDILQTMSKQQESAATLEQLERRTLGNVSEAVAARRSSLNVMQREVITQERINEENERSIQIIRERNKELIQRPIAAMTPGERGVIPAEGGGITLTAGNILDPATLRAERRRRIAALKARKEARGRALSEGLIGGAFPLVFGQGVGASAGGLAGGVAGGLAGGGLGFGLSLIGTALGTALDQLGAAAAETGKALRDPIAGFEKLKEAGLLASKAQEFYIQKLIESGKGAQAAVIIQSEIIKKIGVTGVNDLNRLGKSSYDLSKAWAEFNLQLQAALAGPLAGLLKWVTSIVSLANQEGRSRSAIQDVAQGLTGKKREEFLKRLSKIELGQGGIGNKVLSDLGFKLPGAISAEEANRQRNALAEEYRKFAKQIPISGGLIDPVEAEKQRQAAQQAADEIKQAYREGFALQQQAIDLERQGADLRRQVADEIFAKQQEAQRAQVEAEKLSADIKIKAIDLEYQKRINQEEGRVAELLSAEAELIRVRASGQADIDSKRKLLELDINKQNRETQNYIRNVSVQVDNMRRQTLQYEMQAADYREQVERRINEQRIINQAGANSAAPNGRPYYGPGGVPTGGRISGGATTSRRRDPDAEATGWDIVMPGGRGASVRAPIALTITGTGFQGSGAGSSGRGYGNWISGEFALGGKKYELLLGHFDQVNVARGMQVPAGAELGKQGITGRTFGTHVTTHVNPMRGASVNDAWSALEQITQVWERGGAGGAFGNEINQLQQAQSQVRRPSIPQVDAAAIRNEALRISQQDAQIRRNILGLQNESNKLDEQAAEEKLLSVARGKKELDQLELQLDLIKNRAELTGVYLSAEREGLAPLIGLAAEYSAEVANRIKANKEYIDQAALEPALKNKVLAGMRQELARMKQKYDLQREILAITAAENTAQQAMAALRAITEQNKQLDLEIKQRQLRNSLIIQGINPAIAEGEAKILGIQTLYAEAIAKVNTELNESVRVALEKNGVNADLIDSTFDLSEATIAGLIATQQDTDKQKALRDELERILKLKNALKEGIGKAAGDATGSTRESAKKQAEPGQKIQDYIAQATAELYDLEAMAVRISQSIGDAIGNSLASGITGLIEGTTTAKEIFANFLKDIGQILLQEGAKMIGTYIAIGIAKQFAGLFSGGGGSGYSAAKDFQMPGSAFIPKGGFKFPGAANGAYFSNGIAAFANGGMFSNSIVSSPTLFKFADGGAMRTGVMGEAGPEAIMPLERGSDGRLGVRATGMQDALQRYSTRQQQASEAKGGPGTDNTEGEVGSSVVDVRYNVERINNVDYVTADEFRTGMREAVAQGARQGERQTLRRLQQSSSARKRIGI